MSPKRLAGLFALLVLLTGPLGLLAADHPAFHRPGCDPADAGGVHGAPCPVCHFLSSTFIEAPTLAPQLSAPVLLGAASIPQIADPDARPALTTLRSRAPPSLLS
jgi:hypothetical protein